jgi:hypothetical protein
LKKNVWGFKISDQRRDFFICSLVFTETLLLLLVHIMVDEKTLEVGLEVLISP